MPGRDNRERMTAPFGLDLSLDVFDRATRFARGLFEDSDSTIVLVKDGVAWRSRFTDKLLPSRDRTAEMVIASGQNIWVEDTRLDPRFAENPMVVGPPHIRAWIGEPIRLADGSTPGMLAVYSTRPQPYVRASADRLSALAEFVADEWVRANAA